MEGTKATVAGTISGLALSPLSKVEKFDENPSSCVIQYSGITIDFHLRFIGFDRPSGSIEAVQGEKYSMREITPESVVYIATQVSFFTPLAIIQIYSFLAPSL